MTITDTSERGLERLICTALAGHPCEPPAAGTVAEPPAGYGGVGWSDGNYSRLRPRILRRSGPTLGISARDPTQSRGIAGTILRRPNAA